MAAGRASEKPSEARKYKHYFCQGYPGDIC